MGHISWIGESMYLEILKFKIYIENCAKNKWEEQKKQKEY